MSVTMPPPPERAAAVPNRGDFEAFVALFAAGDGARAPAMRVSGT
jgi:hypothetical protein